MTLRSFLQLFCLAYPRDFRRQYRAQILGDYDQRMRDDRVGVAFGGQLLLDVLFSGLVMRLEFAVRDVNNALRRLRRRDTATLSSSTFRPSPGRFSIPSASIPSWDGSSHRKTKGALFGSHDSTVACYAHHRDL